MSSFIAIVLVCRRVVGICQCLHVLQKSLEHCCVLLGLVSNQIRWTMRHVRVSSGKCVAVVESRLPSRLRHVHWNGYILVPTPSWREVIRDASQQDDAGYSIRITRARVACNDAFNPYRPPRAVILT